MNLPEKTGASGYNSTRMKAVYGGRLSDFPARQEYFLPLHSTVNGLAGSLLPGAVKIVKTLTFSAVTVKWLFPSLHARILLPLCRTFVWQ